MRSMLLAALVSVAVPAATLAQTADELKNDEKTPGDVLTYGMGYGLQRFSPLTQINRDNVKRLVPAWSYSCLLYTSPSPRDGLLSRMPSSA